MKLLYLADIRFPMERANGLQTIETCHALARAGHLVELVVQKRDERSDTECLAFFDLKPHEKLKLTRLPIKNPGTLSARLSFLLQAIMLSTRERSRFDAIYTRDLLLANLMSWMRIVHDRPFFYEAHVLARDFAQDRPGMYGESDIETERKLRRLVRREKRVCRRASGVITITQGLAKRLEALHAPIAPAIAIPDGCRTPVVEALRSERGKRHKKVYYIGQLYPWKGVDLLVQAMQHVQLAELVIVGGLPPEPDLQRLRGLTSDLKLAERVSFRGYLPPSDLASERKMADIFVLPLLESTTARLYTSPLKLFEAMAAGRPLIASDLPSLREVLAHEQNALLVPPGDVDALAAAIDRLAEDEMLSQRLAVRALKDVEAYTWDRRAKAIVSFMERALRKN